MNQGARPTTATPLTPLPLDQAWGELAQALRGHRNLVLVAEPGAGKTTRFPAQLLRSGLIAEGKKILMLEPRRLAARASAHRIAEEQGWVVGKDEIGYQVRFENRTTPKTRLQILTEGLLSRRMQNDPELKDIGAVILDEFHERSQHTDLALSLLFELQELSRPDLRIIVMSATLDADKVSRFLNDCPIVKVPGRLHPVDIRHSQRPLALDTGPQFLDAVTELAKKVLLGDLSRNGDILIFLPGAREIRGVRERLQTTIEKTNSVCFELHGSLTLEEQDRALRRQANSTPSSPLCKVVLATNIAETSLTIDGVGTVIDSGLARVVRLDGAGFERLQISRISMASATQRAGRSGRQGPGICYRLWSKLDEASLPAFEAPEILRTDLSEALLTLLSQGVSDFQGFSWFETPSAESLRLATDQLTDLGFRDPHTGGLTAEGREALKLPLPARLARLMIEATRYNVIPLGANLAALLSEKDFAPRSPEIKRRATIESDAILRLHFLEDPSRSPIPLDRNAIRNIERVSEHLQQAASRIKIPSSANSLPHQEMNEDEMALWLLLVSFPDRICRRRKAKEPQAKMIGGRGVSLAPFSAVETAEFFVALDSSEPPPHLAQASGSRSDAQIAVASRIERKWIEEQFRASISRKTEIVFSENTLSVQKQSASSFHDLPLEDAHTSGTNSEEAFAILLEASLRRWESHFLTHDHLRPTLEKIAFLAACVAGTNRLPPLQTEALQKSFLEEVCYGETRLNDVLGKDLGEAYVRQLPEEWRSALEKEAPDSLIVPSGSRIRIHYPEGRSPYLEVRIQEIFGLGESPTLGFQTTPLVLHLLGPNFRPVQVTADLASFWKSGYAEVRKELRARYPKHSWPEDPTTARPEAKGRRPR